MRKFQGTAGKSKMSVDLFLPFCIAVVTLIFIRFQKGHGNLPPGPWGLPIFGHLIFLGISPYRTLMDWNQKYGPIIYGRMGSFPCIFLCGPKIIKQAYSMVELSGRGDIDALIERTHRKGLLLDEGPRHLEQRRFALTTLKDFGVGRKGIEGHIQESLGQFLNKIETEGRDGRAMGSFHISSAFVIRSLLRVLMTEELTVEQYETIAHINEKFSELGSIISQLAIFMPWIETLARLVTFGQLSVVKQRQASFPQIYRFMEGHIEQRKLSRVKGDPRDIVDAYLDMVDESKDVHSAFHSSKKAVSYFSGDLVAAGVHTTSTSMEWMFLYMATFPSIQRKLQEEIDNVIGRSRLPALSDRSRLPYIDASIHELLRLSSILPLGVDHKSLKDFTLQGYQIPKGALLFANIYGVHYDPQVWGTDVREFKPERWLSNEGRKLKSGNFLPFSTGKRKCIGETLARDTLLIFITGIFQRYTVTFEQGSTGPGLEPVVGFGLSPAPFKMVFTPRDVL